MKAPEQLLKKEQLTLPEKLELARWAFDHYYARCFWFMRKDLEIKPENLESIIKGLRHNGGREGFLLADRLCR